MKVLALLAPSALLLLFALLAHIISTVATVSHLRKCAIVCTINSFCTVMFFYSISIVSTAIIVSTVALLALFPLFAQFPLLALLALLHY